MKHTAWQPKKRIEAEYQNSIQRLFNVFFDKMAGAKHMNPEVLMAAFRAYCQNGNFKAYTQSAVSRMATGLAVESARTWRQAASRSTQGRMIYPALQKEMSGSVGDQVREIVRKNAALISSIPQDIAAEVNRFILEQAMSGKRASEISASVEALTFRPDLDMIRSKIVDISRNRVALIARTETSKASTALTRARAEDLGRDWYIWRTSKDARVRSSHAHMEGVLISWREAPNPEALINVKSNLGYYHAGDAPNDRCYPEPIIDINRVTFPAQVYAGGRIMRMTRAQFVSRFMPERIAA